MQLIDNCLQGLFCIEKHDKRIDKELKWQLSNT